MKRWQPHVVASKDLDSWPSRGESEGERKWGGGDNGVTTSAASINRKPLVACGSKDIVLGRMFSVKAVFNLWHADFLSTAVPEFQLSLFVQKRERERQTDIDGFFFQELRT
jgi:hypothetical protein